MLALLLSACPPIRLSAQCPSGTPPPCGARAARVAAPAPTSVAVLSFDNRSRDTSDAFLAEGLADEISTRLGQIGRLWVISRSQVRRLRGADSLPIPAIGRALNTANLVQGSVQGTPTHLRVSVELLRASNATQVWSHVYDRGRGDLLEIQGDIATEVAQQITGTLRPGDRATLTRRPTGNPEAYEHILRGDVLGASRNRVQIAAALHEYQTAVTLDPLSARAQASIAKGSTLCREYGCMPDVPNDTLVARAVAAADAALRLDSATASAWLASAYANYMRPRGVAALRAARHAVELDSTDAEAWHFLGWLNLLAGDDATAVLAYRRALRIDPSRAVDYEHLARINVIGRHYAEARAQLDTSLEREPGYALGYYMRATLRAWMGDTAGARADAEQLALVTPGANPRDAVDLFRALALVRAGDTTAARAIVDRLDPASLTSPVGFGGGRDVLGYTLLALGRVDEGLRLLLGPEVGFASRHFVAAWSRLPYWEGARGSPTLQRAIAESGATWRER
ncbi:MAG: hypothetical protein ACHQX4_08300 [Gemmatimonadales bacterium]